jgi:membrane-associated protease RseP (regulator of RpoE activity)
MIAKDMQLNMQLSFQRYRTLVNQSLQWIVFIYQVVAVILFLVGLVLADRWLRQPFLGALYEHTLVFNGTGPGDPIPAWALFDQVVVGDQLIAINGESVKSAEEIHSILQGHFPGEEVKVTVRSESGEERILTITLYSFPASNNIKRYFSCRQSVDIWFASQ